MSELSVVKPRWNAVAVVALVVTLLTVVGVGALFSVLSPAVGDGVAYWAVVIVLAALAPVAVVLGIISVLPRYRGRPGRLFGLFAIVFGGAAFLLIDAYYGVILLLTALFHLG